MANAPAAPNTVRIIATLRKLTLLEILRILSTLGFWNRYSTMAPSQRRDETLRVGRKITIAVAQSSATNCNESLENKGTSNQKVVPPQIRCQIRGRNQSTCRDGDGPDQRRSTLFHYDLTTLHVHSAGEADYSRFFWCEFHNHRFV